jgi:hypothetical protein
MNFLEAVQALANGECEGIKRVGTFFSLHLEDHLLKDNDGDIFQPYLDSILPSDWELVNPKPQYEEVEVVRWLDIRTNITHTMGIDDEKNLDPQIWVKLTGTYKREIPRNVKRREEITGVGTLHRLDGSRIPKSAKIYAEWKE